MFVIQIVSLALVLAFAIQSPGQSQNLQKNYYCFGDDPVVNPKQAPNTVACVYVRQFENISTLIRKTRQVTLGGGFQSYGDQGKLEEFGPNEIIFMHEDPKMMAKMLSVLTQVDRYLAPQHSDQIQLMVDVYFLKLEFADGLDFSMDFIGKGTVPSGLPRAGTGPVGDFKSGIAVNFGNLSSSMLKLALGHAKEKGQVLDHYTRHFFVNHNDGFHTYFDNERIYRGSAEKYQAETEQVGLQIYGTVRFTEDKGKVQFERVGAQYASRTQEPDSMVNSDNPGRRNLALPFNEPVYLLHKERHFSDELKRRGLIFYQDANTEVNSILLVTLTPVAGDSLAYGSLGGVSQSQPDIDFLKLPVGDEDSLRLAFENLVSKVEAFPNLFGHRLILGLPEKALTKLNGDQVIKLEIKAPGMEKQIVHIQLGDLAASGVPLKMPVVNKLADLAPRYTYKVHAEPTQLGENLNSYALDMDIDYFPSPRNPIVRIENLKVRPSNRGLSSWPFSGD